MENQEWACQDASFFYRLFEFESCGKREKMSRRKEQEFV